MTDTQTIQLPQGPIAVQQRGQGAPIVFVHGLAVDGSLWRKVTPSLDGAFRCVVPTLPLGAHRQPMSAGFERSPRGVAHLLADLLGELELEDVTLVANDTGGAITQLLISERPERVGRVVLTNCDCYENFLPLAFRPMQWIARVPGLTGLLLRPSRRAWVRRLSFAPLMKHGSDPEVLAQWSEPARTDPAIRADLVAFLRAIDKRDTLAAAERLRTYPRPVLLAWASEDRFFKLRWAQRLAADLPHARIEEIPDCHAFVPEDRPARLADLIAAFVRETQGAPVA
ncbi:MAG TPA: alpha/beta hydrolase [Solirubrobacteraceae bacterium]|nr:alpha/beta hydrolase [Solirubrobacteraceae bacterium]